MSPTIQPLAIGALRHDFRKALVVAGLSALAMGLFSGCSGDSEAKHPTPAMAPRPAVPVSTAAVEERLLPGEIDVTGALAADARTEVAAETTGRVVEVLVERGQVVEPGVPLARLDDLETRNQVREAEATVGQTRERLGLTAGEAFDATKTPEVRQARVTMDRMESDYKRYEQLVERGFVSRSEYDVKRAEFLAQRAQLDLKVNEARQLYQTLQAQQARLEISRKALGDTAIRSPYAGLVAERHVDVGAYVQKGTRVATLVRVDPLRLALTVPEAAITAVKRGQKVAFAVQAYPGRTFEGTVAYVGPALQADSRALVVEALVRNSQGLLQPGLFATARILLPAAQPSVLAPAAAVRTEAGMSRVFVIADGRAELRYVQIGRQVEGKIEVVRGIRAGERVAVGGLERLDDGAAVTESAAGGA